VDVTREEDFFTKFAKAHCAIEASEFLPHPQGKVDFQNAHAVAALIKQTTNKHQTKLRRLVELM
jgi:hypothetical protein